MPKVYYEMDWVYDFETDTYKGVPVKCVEEDDEDEDDDDDLADFRDAAGH
jgi:hypothetical protein